MTLKTKKPTTTPECPLKLRFQKLLDDESSVQKYSTLNLEFLAEQINLTIILERRESLVYLVNP